MKPYQNNTSKQAYNSLKTTADPCMSFKRGDKWYLVKGDMFEKHRSVNVPLAGPTRTPDGAVWRFCIQQTTVEELKQC